MSCWVSPSGCKIWDIFCDDCPHADDAVVADGDAIPNHRPQSDGGVMANLDSASSNHTWAKVTKITQLGVVLQNGSSVDDAELADFGVGTDVAISSKECSNGIRRMINRRRAVGYVDELEILSRPMFAYVRISNGHKAPSLSNVVWMLGHNTAMPHAAFGEMVVNNAVHFCSSAYCSDDRARVSAAADDDDVHWL